MLDDARLIRQHDRQNTFGLLSRLYQQATTPLPLLHTPSLESSIHNIVIVSNGEGVYAANILQHLVAGHLAIPCIVSETEVPPKFISKQTLLIVIDVVDFDSSLQGHLFAQQTQAQCAIITTKHPSLQIVTQRNTPTIKLPNNLPSRWQTIQIIRALLQILQVHKLCNDSFVQSLATAGIWLESQIKLWEPNTPTSQNQAKRIALKAIGKTPIFCADHNYSAIACKWQAAWNQSAKNVAFCTTLSKLLYGGVEAWVSHPVEKPFAIFDIHTQNESELVRDCFAQIDKLLSGRRPHATSIYLAGGTLIEQVLWGITLAEFASAYAATLNNVDASSTNTTKQLHARIRSLS